MATTSQGAKKLRAVMQEMGGEISVDGAREILEAEGLSDRDVGFGLIYGQGRRRWWKRSEDKERLELLEPAGAGPGPGPGLSPAADPAPVAALASPEDRVRATAVQLGISEKLAGTIAAYSSNFDLNRPDQIWGMLGGVPEVGVSARKRLFETLCRSQGLEPSPQLAQLVDSARADILQQQPARRRAYIARAGEVLALDDGEEGLSFGQAIMVADQQIDKMRLAAQAESAREPEGISSLDRILPGLSGKIADLLFASPRSAAGPGVPINLGGQSLTVTEETFLKFQDAEVKRDAVNLVKENLPKLWEVAQDLAVATDRAHEKVMSGKASEVNAECASCHRRFHAPAGTTIFKCGGCGVTQDLASGQMFQELEEEQQQQGQQEPAIPWQRCLNCGSNFQSAGFRCPECAFEPSRLVTDAVL